MSNKDGVVMSEHTPGDWMHGGKSTLYGERIWAGTRVLAVARSEADARLIAAAPTLLEVLQWVDRSGGVEDDPRMWEAVDSAIRLATAESDE